MTEQIVLASSSPRRRELLPLALALLPGGERDFVLRPIPCDEDYDPGFSPEQIVMTLARKKAEASRGSSPKAEEEIIIGCDTLVFLDGKPLGKPADEREAVSMLRTLSGREHQVVTGVCILGKGQELTDYESTYVSFHTLPDTLIEAYVKTGEPLDKAGAYGIQGKGSVLVKGIRGDYFNVVGFPVAKVYRMLAGL